MSRNTRLIVSIQSAVATVSSDVAIRPVSYALLLRLEETAHRRESRSQTLEN